MVSLHGPFFPKPIFGGGPWLVTMATALLPGTARPAWQHLGTSPNLIIGDEFKCG